MRLRVEEGIFDRFTQLAKSMGRDVNNGHASTYVNNSKTNISDKVHSVSNLIKGGSTDDNNIIVKLNTKEGIEIFKKFGNLVENPNDLKPGRITQDLYKKQSQDRRLQMNTALTYSEGQSSDIYKRVITLGAWPDDNCLKYVVACYKKGVSGFGVDGEYGSDILNTIKSKIVQDSRMSYEQLKWVSYILSKGICTTKDIGNLSEFPRDDNGWEKFIDSFGKQNEEQPESNNIEDVISDIESKGYKLDELKSELDKLENTNNIDINSISSYAWLWAQKQVKEALLNDAVKAINLQQLIKDIAEGKELQIPEGIMGMPEELPNFDNNTIEDIKDHYYQDAYPNEEYKRK